MFLIVSGGYSPKLKDVQSYAKASELIIAADRGAKYCLDAEIVPDVVIGDMDSLPRKTFSQLKKTGAEILSYRQDKDETDTHLALDLAIERGAEEIAILSGLGDRVDHTLANIQLLSRSLIQGVHAYLLDQAHMVFLVNTEFCIEKMKGKTVSFLPLTTKVTGITLKGFSYNLEHATMGFDSPYGVSNVITSNKAIVKVSKGMLIGILLRYS